MENKQIIFITGGVSLLLLIFFFYLHYKGSKFLTLDFKWVLVAGTPLLVGLLLSGIIKNFKGFGIELETQFSETVKEIEILGELTSLEPIASEGATKGSSSQLDIMSDAKKAKIDRLIFVNEMKGYYSPYVIEDYFRELKGLKFLEIQEMEGTFIALLPMSTFEKGAGQIDTDQIYKLIQSLENGTITKDFPNCVTSFLYDNEKVPVAYRLISQNSGIEYDGDQILPVLNMDKKLVGLMSKRQLEEKISQHLIKLINDSK